MTIFNNQDPLQFKLKAKGYKSIKVQRIFEFDRALRINMQTEQSIVYDKTKDKMYYVLF